MSNDVDMNMSLGDMVRFEKMCPEFGGFPSRVVAGNKYETWVDKLYEDLDLIIKNQIRPTASYRQDDEEDRFNVDIAGFLNCKGYDASHDKWSNGHPDIYVEKTTTGFKWIGESKIHRKYDDLLEGFKQLTERYSSGFDSEQQGAILIISKNRDIGNMMDTWKDKLTQDSWFTERDIEAKNCQKDKMSFYTEHNHTTSSIKYSVKHIPISIYFNPIDKSGLKSTK
ncbi:hypothetical protein [Vibrio parahaemolyticus]|uniref:hypothetical protein n=1 Tax=Vibrio parahaemolyticus TaxID=670 RepID=UPI00112391A5|nr:hypothetical protein [Vibrio parahaemolyticus]TOL31797.1 hypothetical protein CGI01_15740 [Vibrio parahaemolyticus]